MSNYGVVLFHNTSSVMRAEKVLQKNTIAVKLHTEPGQEVICDSRAHVLDYELAMVAWFSSCVVRAICCPARPSRYDRPALMRARS